MTHIRHATTTFRILSALAAVSLPLAVPSTAATLERDADMAMTQAGLASADVPAMPPMVTGGILASQNDLDPPLAAAMVGVGIPLSAATIAAFVHFFG